MAETIEWRNDRRKLKELIPWKRNPRQINKDQARRLEESFDEFGQVELIAIGPDGEIYNGHQRLNVLFEKFGGDYEVEVRISSRPLSEKEREKLTVFLHKGAAGEWNFDILSEWDIPDLVDWGFKPYELGVIDHDMEGEKSGASPWDRMSGDSADGVLFSFGEITCRVDRSVYESFMARCPVDDISGYIAEIFLP